MRVSLKYLSQLYHTDVSEQTTLDSFFEKMIQNFEEYEGLRRSSEVLRLFFAGHEIFPLNDQTISGIGIKENSTIQILKQKKRIENETEINIQEIYPQSCFEEGGIRVQIRGINFPLSEQRLAICRFGSIHVSGIVMSPNLIITQAPPHPAGAVSLEISINNSPFTSNGLLFTYVARLSEREGQVPVQVENCAAIRNKAEIEHSIYRNRKK